ncbi:MAG: nucleoside hydrolase [Armatimonadetes bacterium CG_4_10_14_3_um_filter_66_18]|nr:nucleoside hydrolase [Armatimonadota bacterium]OIP10272.1 MAG: nucleoside hydrolase [Armatimonadetes bacterium CG2_30_66_41]PIU88104.1 MAG: nucleoside hydrolase [Armatimonadetes bacterium CG06_land_8_20_14_3_00_66_21]PIX50184.1 MAG: nucleoside hydrolase [Armatimonadetes bacterium CG_4_8_14_3_um_filter_66_20]PIY36625.1 MAG: nucleoside hydrolase [Armatimonadetes bacterium CG_4_10_14_3_um_filter_66_18]PIZ43682.1 MAG: nucleoside hydrolase [Armatimonadetes bacterium CG_4_10_14_0_8_um_filter_66_1
MDFPPIDEATRLRRLAPPTGKVSMVLDTDTYNEIDDQFAVVYSLLSPDRLDVEALYAAPFHNNRSSGPGDGMEKSYEEILRLLDRLGHRHDGFVFRGSPSYLPAPGEPVRSEAAEHLVGRALADREGPLYVVPIGCATNVASAMLLEPKIIERIVVVWLGGNPHTWPSASEFNLMQDPPASRLLFDCGVPLVHLPCRNVAEHLRTTVPEMERHVKGQGAIGDYLFDIFCGYHTNHFAWSKVIWDISTIAWLLDSRWVPTHLTHSPILTSELTWSHDASRHFVREATTCNRDAIFGDLFRKLERHASA